MNPWNQAKYGTGKFNRPLYQLRELRGLSQKQMGEIVGYNAHTICRVENGISGGKLDFWQAIQKEFNIPSESMWSLINGEFEEDNK